MTHCEKVFKSLYLGKVSQLKGLCVDSFWESLVLEGNCRAMQEHSCGCQENTETRKGACMALTEEAGGDGLGRTLLSLPTA